MSFVSLLAVLSMNSTGQPLAIDANPVGFTASDPVLSQLKAWNSRWADKFLQQGFEKYRPGALLNTSRQILGKVTVLGMQYRQTHDKRYARRVIDELVSAAAFPNWHPDSFLDTAEMSAAFGLGLSWCGDAASDAERTKIESALVSKGLKPGLQEFAAGADWTQNYNNWTQVCASGLGIAALAIQNDQPQIAHQILTKVKASLKGVDADYVGDGFPAEGPVYFRYGMAYQTLFDAALGGGVLNTPGYKQAAYTMRYLVGPTGESFNFADSSTSFIASPASFRLASMAGAPEIASWTKRELSKELTSAGEWNDEYRFWPLMIAWWQQETSARQLPLDRIMRGKSQAASLRSSWTDPEAAWVAIKGGTNGTPHGHLDEGSFVYEWGGQRWVMDLGKDSYDLPGYFSGGKNGRRWDYFRTSTAGHGTLTFDGKNQLVGSTAPIKQISGNPEVPTVMVDLGAVYAGSAKKVQRIFNFEHRRDLIIQDVIEGARGEIRWQIFTDAQVSRDGDNLLLKKGGKEVSLMIESGGGYQWHIDPVTPKSASEDPYPGIRRLWFSFKLPQTVLRVRISPQPYLETKTTSNTDAMLGSIRGSHRRG